MSGAMAATWAIDVVVERRDDDAVEAVELGELGDEDVGRLDAPARPCP